MFFNVVCMDNGYSHYLFKKMICGVGSTSSEFVSECYVLFIPVCYSVMDVSVFVYRMCG